MFETSLHWRSMRSYHDQRAQLCSANKEIEGVRGVTTFPRRNEEYCDFSQLHLIVMKKHVIAKIGFFERSPLHPLVSWHPLKLVWLS